jgi:hypothetical protein
MRSDVEGQHPAVPAAAHGAVDPFSHRVSNDSDDSCCSTSSSPRPVAPDERKTAPVSTALEAAQKTDVGALVTKSKRAASSLWTLLHAKVCSSHILLSKSC